MINIVKKTTQKWIEISDICENSNIKLKNNKYIRILEVTPINYNLKSMLEKEAILNAYKIFLKTCNFDIQILIQSNKEDLSHHISKIKKNIRKKENKYLKNISEDYIKYISQINIKKKSASKKFYIIITNNQINKKINNYEIINQELNEKYLRIKECLTRCGNLVNCVNEKKEILELFYSFLNTRKYINKINKKEDE